MSSETQMCAENSSCVHPGARTPKVHVIIHKLNGLLNPSLNIQILILRKNNIDFNSSSFHKFERKFKKKGNLIYHIS